MGGSISPPPIKNLENIIMKKIILKQFKDYRSYYFMMIFFTILFEIVYICNPLLIKKIVDLVVLKNADSLILYIGIGFLLIQLDSIMSYYESKYIAAESSKIRKSLKQNIFDKMQQLPLVFFRNKGVGEIKNRLDDIDIVSDYVEYMIFNIGLSILKLTGLLVSMFYLSYQLTLAYLLFSVGEAIINQYYSKSLKELKKCYKQNIDRTYSFVCDRISNIKLIKYYQYEEKNCKDYVDVLDMERQSYLKLNDKKIKIDLFDDLISSNASFVLIALGAYFIFKDMITVGTLFALRAFANRLQNPLSKLAKFQVTQKMYQADFERVSEILCNKDENSLWKSSSCRNVHEKVSSQIQDGKVEFLNVSFTYNSDKYVLKDVNFSLNSGEFLIIRGKSGSGKTTLVNLLLGIHQDYAGLIRIGGRNLRDYSLQEIRKNVGYVTQEHYMLRDSIEKNILMSNAGHSYKKLIEYVHNINLGHLIEDSKNYQKENPILSGGEMQRLSIIRMLLKSSKVCIFDEATSSLDMENSNKVISVIEELKRQGRTIIMVSHDNSILGHADKILSLNQDDQVDDEQDSADETYVNDIRQFKSSNYWM